MSISNNVTQIYGINQVDLIYQAFQKAFQLIFALFRERLMDPNADLTDSEIRLGKGEQVKVSKN